jgi:hypothetical protein
MRNGYVEEFDETTFVFFFFSVGGCNWILGTRIRDHTCILFCDKFLGMD